MMEILGVIPVKANKGIFPSRAVQEHDIAEEFDHLPFVGKEKIPKFHCNGHPVMKDRHQVWTEQPNIKGGPKVEFMHVNGLGVDSTPQDWFNAFLPLYDGRSCFPEREKAGCLSHKQFQTLIGQLQWLISLGRFDIAVHVMSLSRFRAQPRKGHLDRAKRIVGYLLFLPDGAIRFRTGEPDFSSLKDQEYDWTRSVYSGACEQIPHDIPKPLGKHVQTTHYVDANLHHDLATGKAVTAALHFLNQTPIDAYTKRQSTVETATYGSEFVAARTAVDQIIDIRTTLRYLGVPIRGKSYMFGDNRSVVTSSTIPNSTISKRHYLASYHQVREAIAAKYISFHRKDGKSNPADILSKHLEFATVWPMLKPILFWRGETATQLKGSDRIPSTTPGAEPPRDAKESGSARSHSTHLETSSSGRP